MTHPVHKRFEFGTVFGDAGQVTHAPVIKRSYTPEEVEAIRAEAYALGEHSATARAQMAQAQALQALADYAHQGLSTMAEAMAGHKQTCAQLALICAQKIATEALDLFPQAPLHAALEALSQEIDTAPRLVVFSANPDEALQASAKEAATLAGFTGAISFRTQPKLPKGAFEVLWPEGRAEFDPERVMKALDTALSESLAAEYHNRNAAENTAIKEF